MYILINFYNIQSNTFLSCFLPSHLAFLRFVPRKPVPTPSAPSLPAHRISVRFRVPYPSKMWNATATVSALVLAFTFHSPFAFLSFTLVRYSIPPPFLGFPVSYILRFAFAEFWHVLLACSPSFTIFLPLFSSLSVCVGVSMCAVCVCVCVCCELVFVFLFHPVFLFYTVEVYVDYLWSIMASVIRFYFLLLFCWLRMCCLELLQQHQRSSTPLSVGISSACNPVMSMALVFNSHSYAPHTCPPAREHRFFYEFNDMAAGNFNDPSCRTRRKAVLASLYHVCNFTSMHPRLHTTSTSYFLHEIDTTVVNLLLVFFPSFFSLIFLFCFSLFFALKDCSRMCVLVCLCPDVWFAAV